MNFNYDELDISRMISLLRTDGVITLQLTPDQATAFESLVARMADNGDIQVTVSQGMNLNQGGLGTSLKLKFKYSRLNQLESVFDSVNTIEFEKNERSGDVFYTCRARRD